MKTSMGDLSCSQHLVIECAGFITPRSLRKDWLCKWRSELWYVRREAPASRDVWRFCLGSFSDALWTRRYASREKACFNLDSPLDCVMFLISLSLLSLLVAFLLPAARNILLLSLHANLSFYWAHSWAGVSETPPNPIDQQLVIFRLTFTFACLVLPAVTTLHLGNGSERKGLHSRLIRSRWLAFFLLKIVLILPLVYFTALDLGHLFGSSSDCAMQILGSLVGFLFSLRWAFNDHRKRCPTCLGRLSKPLRMGQQSWTLLDWNLIEYMCPKGHGVLHVPAESISGSPVQRWISMDPIPGKLLSR
jgi:hypothetical protein